MRLRPVLALAATLVFGYLSAADLTIQFKSNAKAMMGMGGEGTETHYYSPDYHMVRNEKERRDTMVDFKEGVSYTIDHKKKVITKVTFEDAMAALDALNAGPAKEMPAMLAGMFGDPNDCKVVKGEKETVAGHVCQDWSIKVGKLGMDLAADPALKMPMPDASYAKMMSTRAAQFAKAGPMGASMKRLFEEMGKIKGIPLKTHMTGFMGMDTSTEATKVDVGPIPAGTFALPAGYKLEDAGKKMREEAAKAR